MALDDIEKRLYNMKEGNPLEEEEFPKPTFPPTEEEEEPQQEVPRYYSKETKERPPINFYQKNKKSNTILYIVIAVLFAGLVIEGYFLAQKVSTQKTGIQLDIKAQENILLGEAFDLEVSYKNDSANLLQDAILLIELPDNIQVLGSDNPTKLLKRDLGNLGTGTANIEKYTLVAMGTPNRIANIKATLQYGIVGFTGRFEKTQNQTITVGGPIVDFNISVPQKIVSGEEFSFKVNFINNSTKPLSNLRIQLFYPLGFNYTGASIEPVEGNNMWVWGTLNPQETQEITIRGTIIGEAGSFYEIGANVNLISENQIIALDKKTAMVSILESPLNLSIYVNNSKDYIAKSAEALEYRIDYENNTDIALSEVVIKADLEGQMFNLASLSTNGYFDSLKKEIIWNGGNTPQLKLLNKGDKGSVNFKIYTAGDYPARSFNDKNLYLKVKASIESPSVPPNSSLKSTMAVSELTTKVASKTEVQAYALFRDAKSGIVNKGTLPLKVGKSTNFTVHWKIINYNNDLADVRITATLPQGVGWTGVIAGNYGDLQPQYNERTSEITWNLKSVPAFTGILLPAKELIFQIVATPSSNQVDRYMDLVSEGVLKATDTYTGQEINIKIPAITSQLSADPTVGKEEGIVQP